MKRNFFLKNEIKKILLKSLKKNQAVTLPRRYLAAYYLTTLPKISTSSVPVNRCSFSGRSWGTNRLTNTSRFIFRTKAYNAQLPGCRRAS
jgi:ribosomal protein S14